MDITNSQVRNKGGRVEVGDTAPDFALPSQSGDIVRLSDLLKKSAVVLFFYPADHSAGCTAEACAFRDSYEVFKAAGAEVVGVSSDSIDSHQRFADNHRLPYTLLSDQGGALRKLYGVRATLGLLPGRITYVIDRRGVVRHAFSSAINMQKHVDEALRVLRSLGAEGQ